VTEIKPEWVDALSVAHAEMCDEDMRESGGRYLRTMGEFYVPFLEAVAPLISAEARRKALEEAAAVCGAEAEACHTDAIEVDEGHSWAAFIALEHMAESIRALIDAAPAGEDEWECPINHAGCKSNCGDYGCGN
jgi:hypothetical protein